MSPAWYPVLATVGVQVVIAVFLYGTLWQKTSEHGRRIEQLEEKEETTANKLANLRGHLGLNGG